MDTDATVEEAGQKPSSILDTLTPEEKRCDLYITAIHELNRRRERWGRRRIHRIASHLGLDVDRLTLTWCLLQSLERTRGRSLAGRAGIERQYLHMLHGTVGQITRETAPKPDVADAREALLAAGQGVAEMRSRVQRLLQGSELEFRIREQAEYEDDVSLSSDDEDDSSPLASYTKAVKRLPNAENLPPEQICAVATKLATFAKSLKEGDRTRVSERVVGRAKHRTEAVRWLCVTDNYRKTAKRRRVMSEAVESIGEEAGVRLHPVAKRALVDGFVDEESLAEGGLSAFRALIPRGIENAVRGRELKRLLKWMKVADVGIAEKLIDRFGSARRCLRADVSELCKMFGEGEYENVIRRIHGVDEALKKALCGRVVNGWLVGRILMDKFGGIDEARRASFGKFFDGGGEIIRLSNDERLSAYQAIHEESFGSDRERYDASWRTFCAVCVATKTEDSIDATRWVLERLERGDAVDVWSLCMGGMDSDEAERLRMCLANGGMPSGAEYLS